MNAINSPLANIIRGRQTWKVLGDPNDPIRFPSRILETNSALVRSAIATAGWAPFHYDRGIDGIAEPWRIHTLWTETCRQIAVGIPSWFDLKASNKLPAMLSACGCLVLVTWLPQFRGETAGNDELSIDKKREIDDEHLCATAALVQNLLLLLHAEGLGTYWSSGGQLGSEEMFNRLGISRQEQLAAAVFVEYPGGSGPVFDRLAGKNRERRADAKRWSSESKLVD